MIHDKHYTLTCARQPGGQPETVHLTITGKQQEQTLIRRLATLRPELRVGAIHEQIQTELPLDQPTRKQK